MPPELTTLNRSDLPELLELCARELPLDTFSLAVLRDWIFGDARIQPELTLGLRESGRLIGVAVGVIRTLLDGERHGWLKLLAVAGTHRGKRLGARLVRELESRFRAAGARVYTTAGAPWYFWPGVDVRYTPACCLFEREGFSVHRHNVNMAVDLAGQSFDTTADEERLAREGLTLRRADADTLPAILDMIRSEWPLGWPEEAIIAAQREPATLFHIARGREVLAFAAYDTAMFAGTFGPTGTHPVHRGRGLGGILLRRCLQDMKQRGYPRCEIAWVGPVGFYAKQVGATICRVFREYRKELQPD